MRTFIVDTKRKTIVLKKEKRRDITLHQSYRGVKGEKGDKGDYPLVIQPNEPSREDVLWVDTDAPSSTFVNSINGQSGDVDLADIAFSGSFNDLIDVPDAPVLSVNGETGAVTLDKSDIGLNNVDNTSDISKPISTLTQAALDTKALDVDLDSHTSNTNNPHSVTKSQVGLSSVDNTSDIGKPISTATQTALNLKRDVISLVDRVYTTGTGGVQSSWTYAYAPAADTFPLRTTNGQIRTGVPSLSDAATTKLYVDNLVAAIPLTDYVLKSGDTMSGPLSAPATTVSSGSVDLNNYTDNGTWVFTSGATLTNAPAVNGFLHVISVNPSTTTGQENSVKQVWYRLGTNDSTDMHTYVRTRNSTTWSSWVRLATTTTAETLTNKTLTSPLIGTQITPTSNNTVSNGSSSAYWSNLYAQRHYFNSTAYIDGANAGQLDVTGLMTAQNIRPLTNFGYDLGTNSIYWGTTFSRRLFLNATASIDGTTAGRLDVSGTLNTSTVQTASIISNNGTAGLVRLSGGTIDDGAVIVMGGSTHASIPNQGLVRVATNNIWGWTSTGVSIGSSATAVATHSLTLQSNSTGIALYNTSDQTTNYERVRQYWSGNTFFTVPEAGGTGSVRAIQFGLTGTALLINNLGSTKHLFTSSSPSASAIGVGFIHASTASSGIGYGISITPTINQSGTAGYTAHLINVTETATGSGAKNLIDAQVGGTSLFSVSNLGILRNSSSDPTPAIHDHTGTSSYADFYFRNLRTSANGTQVNYIAFARDSSGTAVRTSQITNTLATATVGSRTSYWALSLYSLDSVGTALSFSGLNATFGGRVITGAASTSQASLRIPSGVAPTSPNDGDIWYDGTSLGIRQGSTTKAVVTGIGTANITVSSTAPSSPAIGDLWVVA